MKGKRFTEEQIIGVLKEAEAGIPIPDLLRKHGIATGTFYRWKSKYGGKASLPIPLIIVPEIEIPNIKSMDFNFIHSPEQPPWRFVPTRKVARVHIRPY